MSLHERRWPYFWDYQTVWLEGADGTNRGGFHPTPGPVIRTSTRLWETL